MAQTIKHNSGCALAKLAGAWWGAQPTGHEVDARYELIAVSGTRVPKHSGVPFLQRASQWPRAVIVLRPINPSLKMLSFSKPWNAILTTSSVCSRRSQNA